jgi:hypothetical protein
MGRQIEGKQRYGQANGWTDKGMDRQKDGQTNGWIDKLMDRQTDG